MAWGYHFVLDCHKCNPEKIRDGSNIENFAKELVEKIDMVAYGAALVIHFGEDDKAGYTLVQLIETSNICGHFSEERNSAYLDIFSCKEYNQDTVLEVVNKYFEPEHIHSRYLERD